MNECFRFKVVAKEAGNTVISVLSINCATLENIGNYSCHATSSEWSEDQVSRAISLDIFSKFISSLVVLLFWRVFATSEKIILNIIFLLNLELC